MALISRSSTRQQPPPSESAFGIEPYPRAFLENRLPGISRLIMEKVQDVHQERLHDVLLTHFRNIRNL